LFGGTPDSDSGSAILLAYAMVITARLSVAAPNDPLCIASMLDHNFSGITLNKGLECLLNLGDGIPVSDKLA